VISEEGKEALVGILEPEQFFGKGCLNGHPLRIGTTTALEDCVITSITKAAMIAVLIWSTSLFNSSEKRLARLLLLLANFGNDSPPQLVLAEISQATLAEMIGTTRSRVSFFETNFGSWA
jgi:CRP/FNR family transcriptional regulator, cyclic AMP receptor protein